jgi:CBS domain-containing protein
MKLRARDVMQGHVVTVGPDTPLLDVHRLFVEEEINGAPVVDETGKLLGVISSLDLLREVDREHESPSSDAIYFRDVLEYSAPDWAESSEDFQDRLTRLRVSDAMTPGGVTVAPDAPIEEVAKTLRSNRIHRVLVVERGELVGLISTFDLVELLETPTSGRGKA